MNDEVVVICNVCGQPCEVVVAWPWIWVSKCCRGHYPHRKRKSDIELEKAMKDLGIG